MDSRHQEKLDAAVQVDKEIEFILEYGKSSVRIIPFMSSCSRPFQALQQAVNTREESLLWLKSRLAALSEVSPEVEVQRQRAALAKLSTDLRALLSSLCQVNQVIHTV